MRKNILLCLSAALAAFAGCASSKPQKVERLPTWYETVPKDTESHLYSATMGESRKMDVAIKKAKTQARAELAQKLGTKVQNLEKLFQEEVGADPDTELLEQFTSVTKTITSETLYGTQEEEKEIQNLENGELSGVHADDPAYWRGEPGDDGQDPGKRTLVHPLPRQPGIRRVGCRHQGV